MKFLNEKYYQRIVIEVIGNAHPKRVVEHLNHFYKKYAAENLLFWQHVRDAVSYVFPNYDYERTYDVKSAIEDDYEFAFEEEIALFIYLYASEEADKQFEAQQYNRRQYTLNHLLALVLWIKKQIIEPSGIRYQFKKTQINFFTSKLLDLVLNENLVVEEPLLKIERNNLSVYIKIYFSVTININEINPLDEIIFIDYRKPMLPIAYKVIGERN